MFGTHNNERSCVAGSNQGNDVQYPEVPECCTHRDIRTNASLASKISKVGLPCVTLWKQNRCLMRGLCVLL